MDGVASTEVRVGEAVVGCRGEEKEKGRSSVEDGKGPRKDGDNGIADRAVEGGWRRHSKRIGKISSSLLRSIGNEEEVEGWA